MATEYKTFLKDQDITLGFSEREIEVLCNVLIAQVYKTGDLILAEGKNNQNFYFLFDGTAEVVKYDRTTEMEFRINSMNRGAMFGEMSVIMKEPISASIKAHTDCTILILANDRIEHYSFYYKMVVNCARLITNRLRLLSERHAESLGEKFKEQLAKERLSAELQAAYDVQTRLLPDAPPQLIGFDIDGYSTPARHVGGDFYDFVKVSDDKYAFVLGDVSGKGIPAALIMAECRSVIRAVFVSQPKLTANQVLEYANLMIFNDSEDFTFVTCFLCIFDIRTGEFSYSNAGHNPPFLYRSSGEIEELQATGTVLGFSDMMTWETEHNRLSAGDSLIIYSDGITEAVDSNGVLFEDDRLKEVILKNTDEDAEIVLKSILERVREFTDDSEPTDDKTVMVIKRTSQAQ